MFSLFIDGGALIMSIITLLLIALFFAAWKAPSWVKEIGLAAFAVSILSTLINAYHIFDVLKQVEGNISPGVLFGGLKVSMIPIIYGLSVYILSLVVRVILKPKVD